MTDEEMLAEQKRIEREFERAYDAHPLFGPVNDDEFLNLATQIFFAAAFQDEPIAGVAQKAARALATRLSGFPDDTKNWRVTFPPMGLRKEQMLTKAQKKSRAIAFEVCRLILAGELMTHATATVATKRKVSPQKVTGDYYKYRGLFVDLHRSSNPDDTNVSKLED
ncbi:hypothetical protein [Paraburkholderia phenoliruptrix]|uniref:hypothetical protein n=1 Tax=Paraburkholderia phenoliruptrix TaxID=252970 RepID=UPI001C6F3005|nr:hypothetical protein [Paraburkholderia phenoliruptrix]MBW9108118.1 hypothetical protein [Paraburkholderia phenoliruptrix]MBW9133467.1 hypothetical protein [Paraburkholderia ginsengiterrae]